MKNLKAKIETKSNYRNLNGQWLVVKQFLGTQVACTIIDEDLVSRTVDFHISEIKEIKEF